MRSDTQYTHHYTRLKTWQCHQPPTKRGWMVGKCPPEIHLKCVETRLRRPFPTVHSTHMYTKHTYRSESRGGRRGVLGHAHSGRNATIHDTHWVCRLLVLDLPRSLYKDEKEERQQTSYYPDTQRTKTGEEEWRAEGRWRGREEKEGMKEDQRVTLMRSASRHVYHAGFSIIPHRAEPYVRFIR